MLRILTLGVIDGYRKLGIEACLYGGIIKNSKGTKIKGGECSWMLEENSYDEPGSGSDERRTIQALPIA